MHIAARGPSLVTFALALTAMATPGTPPELLQRAETPEASAPCVAVVDRGCAPSGPLSLALDVATPGGGSAQLDYALQSAFDVEWLEVEVDLVHGGRVLSHARPSGAALAHGVTRSGQVLVELPEGARRGEHVAEVRVIATSAFATADGSLERVVSSASITLGAGDLPVEATRVFAGGQASHDVPSRHEGGAR